MKHNIRVSTEVHTELTGGFWRDKVKALGVRPTIENIIKYALEKAKENSNANNV